MDIVVGDDVDEPEFIQGPRSSRLKFRNPICEACNTRVTQPADLAFDFLLASIEQQNALDDNSIGDAVEKTMSGGAIACSVFRHFAKILGCQLADFGAPIPLRLAAFVSCRSDVNCVNLWARGDITFKETLTTRPKWDCQYMAHGGIVMIARLPLLLPSRAYSTLTVGPVQFIFDFVFSPLEILEMRRHYPQFVELCAERVREAVDEPIPASILRRLGLTPQLEE